MAEAIMKSKAAPMDAAEVYRKPKIFTLQFDFENNELARKMVSAICKTAWYEPGILEIYERNFLSPHGKTHASERAKRARWLHTIYMHQREGILQESVVVSYAMFKSEVKAPFSKIMNDTDCECYHRALYVMKQSALVTKKGSSSQLVYKLQK